MCIEHDDDVQPGAMFEVNRVQVDSWRDEEVLHAFYMHHWLCAWMQRYRKLLQMDRYAQSHVFYRGGQQ